MGSSVISAGWLSFVLSVGNNNSSIVCCGWSLSCVLYTVFTVLTTLVTSGWVLVSFVFYVKLPVVFSVVIVYFVITGLVTLFIVVIVVKVSSLLVESVIIYSLGFTIPMAWPDFGATI